MRLRLSPWWSVRADEAELVCTSETRVLRMHVGSELARRFTDCFSAGIASEPIDADDAPWSSLLRSCRTHRILIEHAPRSDGRLSREFEYWTGIDPEPDARLRAILGARIAVFGLGGVGSVAVQQMLGMGARRFTLLDLDRVELSNLHRQPLYTPDDIGLPKALAARRAVQRLLPGAEIDAHVARVEPESVDELIAPIVQAADFVIVAIDQPIGAGPRALLDLCWKLAVPAAFATVGFQKGVSGPVFDRARGSADPLTVLGRTDTERIRPVPLAAAHTSLNTIVATFLAEQVVCHVAGAHTRVDYRRAHVVEFATPDGVPRISAHHHVQVL